jgi:hypothetical protein
MQGEILGVGRGNTAPLVSISAVDGAWSSSRRGPYLSGKDPPMLFE